MMPEEQTDGARRSDRERVYTEEGKAYRIEFLTKNFKSLGKSVNSRIRACSDVIAQEHINISVAKAEKDSLAKEFDSLNSCYLELEALAGQTIDARFVGSFEELETSCTKMLVSLGQAICDVISETGSRRGLGLENRSGAVNEQLGDMSQPVQASGATAALQPPVSAPSQPPVSAASQPLISSATLPVGQPAALLPPVSAPSQPPVSAASQPLISSATLPAGQPPDSDRDSVGSSSSASLEIVRTLCSQLALSRLPTPEPAVFSGDPLKYSSWKRSFETLISSKAIPKEERIHYLDRYLAGDAKSCVEGLFLIGTAQAFDDAFKLLDSRFGDDFVVGNAFRSKLEQWPRVDGRDSAALRRFADFLRQCEAAKSTLSGLRFLDDDRENHRMLSKLPDWLIPKWGSTVADTREKHKRFPLFSEFVSFVVKQSDIANDPITSIGSVRAKASSASTDKSSKSTSRSKSDSKGRSLQSKANQSSQGQSQKASKPAANSKSSSGDKKAPVCLHCSGEHLLRSCKRFCGISEADREAFVKAKRLCLSCLRAGHQSKECRDRSTCDVCSKRHPTSLHGFKFTWSSQSSPQSELDSNAGPAASGLNACATTFTPDADSVSVASANTGAISLKSSACQMSSMIVPVFVYHKDNPTVKRKVYALLDSQSDTTFVLGSVCDQLGISGPQVNLSLSTMHAENEIVCCRKVAGLVVQGYRCPQVIDLPCAYTRDVMPVDRSHIPCASMAEHWPHLNRVVEKLMPVANIDVALLIGYNCSRALLPREVIPCPSSNGPFAQRTDLGWGIVGVINPSGNSNCACSHRVLSYSSVVGKDISVSFRTRSKEVMSSRDVLKALEPDFSDQSQQGRGLSVDDQKFLEILGSNIVQLPDGFYQMPLPFRDKDVPLESNLQGAMSRLRSLMGKLQSNPDLRSEYVAFMQDMLSQDYCEEVPLSQYNDSRAWFIPHHGVYHAVKKKLRVVFDCSARFRGVSLNDCLLQGPDLTNNLFGVLCRFRQEPVAFMCDITKMFYRFKVAPGHRDYLRFLWFKDGDLSSQPVQFRMTVHIFGASSSPGCANFGLKQVATDFENHFGTDVGDFIRNDFYVDDGLKSVASDHAAVDLINRTVSLCARGNLKLHKFVSNSREVLKNVDKQSRADSLQDIDLGLDSLPVERALGLGWNVDADVFCFKADLKERPFTHRGMLSTVMSVYDPLGFLAPISLQGKRLLQLLCVQGLGWDDPISSDMASQWQSWLSDVKQLSELRIRRCVKPPGFSVAKVEFHHFCDGSLLGFGFCSYLRLISTEGQVFVSLVMAKARVSPIKPTTVPRLELSAAVLAVKASLSLDKEFAYQDVSHEFWCDSKVVLGYIANSSRRFHIFVSNRVGFIQSHTTVMQWHYVPSSKNVADIASRGCSAKQLADSRWFNGPEFLWQSTLPDFDKCLPLLGDKDPEVRSATVHVACASEGSVLDLLTRFSSLQKVLRIVAYCVKFFRHCAAKCRGGNIVSGSLTPADLNDAECRLACLVQQEHFGSEIAALRSGQSLSRKGVLYKLNPFMDSDGLLKVGGRLRRSSFPDGLKHPVLLPKDSCFTGRVIARSHEKVAHSGKGMTLNEVRSSGYWILGGTQAVSSFIHNCVVCRKLRFSAQGQQMADLPADRLESVAPFTNVGVDFFGPFIVKEGRKELKRYGVIYTCLVSRAVHLEVANALTTSSFLNSLRRFLSIRGPISLLRADRGTNFVGASRELSKAWSEIKEDSVREFLLDNGAAFEFKFNPASASHFGGVWERLIRSVRSILDGILSQTHHALDDESLRTYLCEVAAIINGRPLTLEYISDPDFLDVLTPNHLLTLKSKVLVAPPGEFSRDDLYSVKRWRRVQVLCDLFWSRFRKEYIHLLQSRSKWNAKAPNLKVGDVVLVKDENLPRSQWNLGRVTVVFPSDDGLVRSVELRMADRRLARNGKRVHAASILQRPVHKLVLVLDH